MQNNILQYLEQTVCRVPNKVAFASEDTRLTFAISNPLWCL